jgi:hypothetical protein
MGHRAALCHNPSVPGTLHQAVRHRTFSSPHPITFDHSQTTVWAPPFFVEMTLFFQGCSWPPFSEGALHCATRLIKWKILRQPMIGPKIMNQNVSLAGQVSVKIACGLKLGQHLVCSTEWAISPTLAVSTNPRVHTSPVSTMEVKQALTPSAPKQFLSISKVQSIEKTLEQPTLWISNLCLRKLLEISVSLA